MATSGSPSLPPDRPGQIYVKVQAIEGGLFTLADRFFIAPSEPEADRLVPSLAFLITHPGSHIFNTSHQPLRMMYDLGLRSKFERYIPGAQTILSTHKPYDLEPGALGQLEKGGLTARDIDVIMLSHVHYDHHGDPENFPHSKFLLGHGSMDVLAHGLPGKGPHQHFDPKLLPQDRTIELPPVSSSETKPNQQPDTWVWKLLGPLPATIDLLGDGSVYVVDMPGHLPGHINLLCRLGPQKWVCLCGDAYHDRRLLTGEKEIATWEDEAGQTHCIHLDRAAAAESIAMLRRLGSFKNDKGDPLIDLIGAHDEGWYERNKDNLFPNSL